MKIKMATDEFVFDPRKTEHYLNLVSAASPELLPDLEKLLDGKHNTGYRPVNSAIYSALVSTLKKKDTCILYSRLSARTVSDYATSFGES